MIGVYSWLGMVCMCAIVYGTLRYGIAVWRHEENSRVHILWIPSGGILFAFITEIYVLTTMYHAG